MTRVLPGLASLVGEFDTFLVDIFGTLHDGRTAYPGAVPALRRLRAAGGRVVLLSNSGRRSAVNAARLPHYGLGEADYDVLLTSGEVAWALLRAGSIAVVSGAERCLLIARDDDRSILDGLPFTLAAGAEDADFVLLSGSEGERRPMDDYAAILAPAARRGLPLICCNPDQIMLTESGPGFGAGRIAERYAELGGRVTLIGKPRIAIYDAAFQAVGSPSRARAIGIGDSMTHDVAGARAAGAAGALVLTGVAGERRIAEFEAGAFADGPDIVLPGFVWETAADASQIATT